MKKLVALSIALFLFASCSLDSDGSNDDSLNFSFEILPIDSVDIPDKFSLGQTYPIKVSYFQPSTCHSFKEFYHLIENNERTIAVIDYVFDNGNCQTLTDELVDATIDFTATSNGSYIFKFWQGQTSDGEDEYLIIEVPVIE